MYSKYGKRIFDVFVSLLSLVVLSPLMALISLLIFLEHAGPVFFVQKRVGLNGKIFNFIKFRSMPVDTGDIPSHMLNDIKFTILGRFIRRTNIDELPQLYNVLVGDMSSIGPRPSLPSQKELIALRKCSGASTLRPGLTGLAQVNSFDGMSTVQKSDFDSEYFRKMSVTFDMIIVLKTLTYLLKTPPKY